jgi:hypothetical protein
MIDWLKTKILKKKKKFLFFYIDLTQYFNKLIALKYPNKLIKSQLKDTSTIPIIIINFNQLFYLKQLISFLEQKKTKNIIIIDNNSSYPPLLDYYNEINNRVTIHRLNENLGHLVLWKKRELFKKYTKGFFVLTDADIVPNSNLKEDYLNGLLKMLLKHKTKSKVGLALKIDDIPNTFILKENVINWETKFWISEIEKNVFDAEIDTTFALYWPKTDRLINYLYPSFFNALRVGGEYIATHGGWYIDHNNLTEEQKFYFKTANNSNSWKIDNEGNLDGDFKNDY